ncbi:MAG: hypothetical protein ACLVHV_11070 [Oscillospiraceae bacterium]
MEHVSPAGRWTGRLLSSVTRPSCTAPLWPFWATPRRREDASGDTFLRYLEKAPVFSCPAQEAAWMTRVTVNRCISLLRPPWRCRRIGAAASGARRPG